MERPTVSILLCVKNEATTVSDLFDSIDRQTFSPEEVIVVDNGSTDDTVRVVSARGYAPLRSGGTLSDARRVGAAAVRGRYLFVVDADQVLADDCIERCLETFRVPGTTAVVIPERAYRPANAFARITSYEREISERAGRGIPRAFLFQRYREIGGHGDNVLFGEDAQVRLNLTDSEVRIAGNARIYHKELSSAWIMLRKYFNYGRAVHRNTDIADRVTTWRAGSFLRVILESAAQAPTRMISVVAIKVMKFFAIQAGRAYAAFERRK